MSLLMADSVRLATVREFSISHWATNQDLDLERGFAGGRVPRTSYVKCQNTDRESSGIGRVILGIYGC